MVSDSAPGTLRGSLARQFAWAAATLATAAVVLIAGGSWWWIERLQREASQALSQKDADLRAARVSATLFGVAERLAEIARSPVLATALTDSQGREAYLQPYLGSIQTVNSTPVELLLVDFEGREIARNGDLTISPAQRDWLKQQLQAGDRGTRVTTDASGADLLVAEMVRYSRTKTVEGALLLKLPVQLLLADSHYRLRLAQPADVPVPDEIRAAVRLPEAFGDLRFEVVHVQGARPSVTLGLHPLNFVVFALLLIASFTALGLKLAQRLTADLRSLESFTRDVASQAFGTERASVTGAQEVAGLAQSVNLMLDRLNEQHDSTQSESAAQLRLLSTCIARLNDMVMITDAGTPAGGPRIVFVNDAFERITGYSREEVIGELPSILQGPDTDRQELNRVRSSLQAWQPVRAELLNYTKTGVPFWIEMDIVPVGNGDGWFTHWVSVERDITERRQAVATQRLLQAQVQEAQRMDALGTLAGGVAHDFNNILGAIFGNLALVRSAIESGHPAQGRLEQIDRSASRARSLVQQILSFSRRQPAQARCEPLRPVVEETLALLRATVPARVKIDCVLADAPIYVMADATALQQVLMNLGTNAWHALQGSSGCITFGLASVQMPTTDASATPSSGLLNLPAGRYAHLWVRDDGCGIAEAVQARIFEPFFTTKPVGSGTGLGLSVVHGIVGTYGGTVTLESAPGAGSTFHIHLPQVAAPATPPGPAAQPLLLAASGRGQRVMYLDDDEVMVIVAEALLVSWGYRVTALRDAQQALAALRADPAAFDLVVTDFNMPELSGLEVLRELQRIRPGLPLILTSGYLPDEVRAEALAAGVFELLNKEDIHDDLPAAIARAFASAGPIAS